jgi:hypothetical protein
MNRNHALTPSGKLKRVSVIVEWLSKVWKGLKVTVFPKSFSSAVCLIWKMECKMTFVGKTVKKMARVHHWMLIG